MVRLQIFLVYLFVCCLSLCIFTSEKENTTPNTCQLGSELALIAGPQFSTKEHKPFHTFICDHDAARQTKDHSLNMSEHRQKQKHCANHKQSNKGTVASLPIITLAHSAPSQIKTIKIPNQRTSLLPHPGSINPRQTYMFLNPTLYHLTLLNSITSPEACSCNASQRPPWLQTVYLCFTTVLFLVAFGQRWSLTKDVCIEHVSFCNSKYIYLKIEIKSFPGDFRPPGKMQTLSCPWDLASITRQPSSPAQELSSLGIISFENHRRFFRHRSSRIS